MKGTLYFECNSGISGDMAVASMIDLGIDQERLIRTLRSIPADGFDIRISRVYKSGIEVCDFDVVLEEDSAFVYAVDSENRIEKRYVTLGDTDDENGIFEIVDGLSFKDRIAFPDETVQVGMAVSETSYMPEDMMGSDDEMGFMNGMEGMDGMPGMPMDEYASDMDAPEEPVGGPDA